MLLRPPRPGCGTALNAATDPFSTVRFLGHWLRDRTLAERKFPSVIIRPRTNLFSLDFHAEQAPNRDSRIGLATRNRPVWQPPGSGRLALSAARTWKRSAKSFELLRDDLAEQAIGQLTLAADEADIETVVRRDGAYGGHHIGTARMGASRRPVLSTVTAKCLA